MLSLRAIDQADLEQLRAWRNALFTTGFFRQWQPISHENQQRWWESIRDETDHIMRAIEVDGTLIGVVGLTYLDWRTRRGEASIYIGDAKWRGAGHGLAALQAICEYGFKTVGLHRIEAEIFAFNPASVALFERAGFRREGVLVDRHFHAGHWHNSIMYALIAPGETK